MPIMPSVSRRSDGRSGQHEGLGGDLGANFMFALATTDGLVSIVGVLGALYPVVTVLLAWLFLAERLRMIETLGVAVALTGVVLISAS
jgi:uncharacterized membrane protein